MKKPAYVLRTTDYFPIFGPRAYLKRNENTNAPWVVESGFYRIKPYSDVGAVAIVLIKGLLIAEGLTKLLQ